MLKRALMRGKISIRHANSGRKQILASIVALPAYIAFLPITLLIGHHHFMRYLVKACDHAGRLCAAVGINPLGENYVTE